METFMLELNKIYNMDTFEMLKKLDDDSVDLFVADPDYNVGIKYNDKSYKTDFDSYISAYISLASEAHRILKDTGNAVFINYDKNNSYLRVLYLDRAFYEVANYVWVYATNTGFSPNKLTTAHRSLLHARKTKDSVMYKENIAEAYKNPNDKRIRRLRKEGSKGRMPYSWKYFNQVKNVSKSKRGIDHHPCVIPDGLTSLFVKGMTSPGDTVVIPYAGSGSEIDVCRRLGRNFIAAELDPNYCEVIEKQLDKDYIEFEQGVGDDKDICL
jgi:DNA modification methylase